MSRPNTAHAEKLKTLVEKQNQGVLSSVMTDSESPYGSLINIARIDSTQIITLMSDLAQHTKNIKENPEVSLFVQGDNREGGLDRARGTLLGKLKRIEKTERLRSRFLEVHPSASDYIGFDDFSFYRLEIERARYIGGFGEISWIRPRQLEEAVVDEVWASRNQILDELNSEPSHRAFDISLDQGIDSIEFTDIDRYLIRGNIALPETGEHHTFYLRFEMPVLGFQSVGQFIERLEARDDMQLEIDN